jgi:hypothetical protein
MDQEAMPRNEAQDGAAGEPRPEGEGQQELKKKSKTACCLGCLGVGLGAVLIAAGVLAYFQWDKVGDLLFYRPPVQQKPDIDGDVLATFEEFPLDGAFEVVGVSGVVDQASMHNTAAKAGATDATYKRLREQMKESFDASTLPEGLSRQDLATAADVTFAKYRKKSAGYRADPGAYRGGARYEKRFEGQAVTVCVGRTADAQAAQVRCGVLYRKAMEAARKRDTGLRTAGVRITTAGGKVYEGFKLVYHKVCCFFLFRRNARVFLVIRCSAKMEPEVKQLLKSTGESGGIDADAAARKNIYVLPAKRPAGLVFLGFFTRQLDESYVREKGGAEWAREMKGIWNTDALYLDKGGRLVVVSYFDAESTVRAVRIYDVLYSLPTRLNKDARAAQVRGRGGWFVDSPAGRELNFRVGWYINAVNGYPKMEESELRAIADLLQM